MTKFPKYIILLIERKWSKMPLKSFKTNKKSLLPIFDIYLNEPQEIWVLNTNLKRNTNPNDWVQLPIQCKNCGWRGIERVIGQGYQQHFVEIDNKKLLRESYPAQCPYCKNAWEIDTTRPYDPKTLAMSIDDDLNDGISEVDEEIKEKNDEI